MIDENSQEVITTEGLNNLRSSFESGDYNLKNIITQKGEQTEFHPDSLRAWAEQTMKKVGDVEGNLLNTAGDLPCQFLPDGTIHCGNPDPDPGDPTPPASILTKNPGFSNPPINIFKIYNEVSL